MWLVASQMQSGLNLPKVDSIKPCQQCVLPVDWLSTGSPQCGLLVSNMCGL